MLTNINVANALTTVAAGVDSTFVTQDNLIIATGNATGSAVLNTGTIPLVIDTFTTAGPIALDTSNNHIFAADGANVFLRQNATNTSIMLVAQGDLGGALGVSESGLSFTPDVGDGRLGLFIDKNGATLDLSLDGAGTINFGGLNPVITVAKDFSLNFNGKLYSGIPIMGTIHGDGVNDVQATLVNGTSILLSSNGTVGGNLNLGGVELNNITLSGTVAFDPLNNAITFAQGSSLGVDLGTRRVNFTATDNAGGQLTFGTNGLTFNTAGGDGGLILSITENGATRQATLDVVGTITYSLDGSIMLGAGTVVRNIFEDGNILTITANTDASGSVVFSPQGGLYITPSTPDALNVVLSTDGLNVVNISSITGTINYTGGIVTASDGAQAHLMVYDTWETELRTTGGTASVQFTGDRTVYTANDGATFVLDYLDGTTVEIQHGSFSDIYATETSDAIELVSAGSSFKCNNDEFTFTLETAGNYTLNGVNVTTTADNVQVQLTNYDTIIVDGITYTPLEENAALTIDANGANVTSGQFSYGLAESADIAGDFLPNYTADFNDALQLTNAETNLFGSGLSDLITPETPRLGEISLDTQIDELSKPQIVIAAQN